MRNRCLIIYLCMSLFFAISVADGHAKDFPVFDALLYSSKPYLEKDGLRKMNMVYDGVLWNSGESRDKLNSKNISKVARGLDPSLVTCIDIEDWPTAGKPDVVRSSIAKYTKVISIFRQERPRLKLGYYGILPHNDYWRATGEKGQKEYDEWVQENNILKEIAKSVDVIFPSLYTFYPDQKRWEEYAIENLKEARKYGKPVYAFIWPEFHDSNATYKGQTIPADFWRFELETCYKYADGVVIWGGFQKRWDEKAPWWIETKKFLKEIKDKSAQ